MTHRQDNEPLDSLWQIRGADPREIRAPVVSDERHPVRSDGVDDAQDVVDQEAHGVLGGLGRLGALAAAAKIGHHHPVTGREQFDRDVVPERRRVRPAV